MRTHRRNLVARVTAQVHRAPDIGTGSLLNGPGRGAGASPLMASGNIFIQEMLGRKIPLAVKEVEPSIFYTLFPRETDGSGKGRSRDASPLSARDQWIQDGGVT